MIRAVQGHSMKEVVSEELLKEVTNPFKLLTVIHGTYYEPLPLIMQHGLNRMGRNHVHLAPGLPHKKEVISGMRSSCQVVIELNMVKAMHGENKLNFFTASNGVVLCEGYKDGSIPREFFRSVIDYPKS